MPPQQITETIECLDDIEDQLDFGYDLDADQLNLHMHLTRLHRLIEQLMNDTFETANQDLKVKLAMLEKKARELLDEVRDRLGVYN